MSFVGRMSARLGSGSRKRTSMQTDDELNGEVLDVPSVPKPQPVTSKPELYGLDDQKYGDWKRARAACRRGANSIESLKTVAADRKLLNWRNPVDGQTLLLELVAAGASNEVVEQAIQLGCDPELPNSQGQTLEYFKTRSSNAYSSGGAGRGNRAFRQQARVRKLSGEFSSGSVGRSSQAFMEQAGLAEAEIDMLPSFSRSSRRQLDKDSAAQVPSIPSVADTSARRKGISLKQNQKSKMPKAKMNLEVDFCEERELDPAQLEAAVKKTYGGSARVQIDEVADKVGNCQQSRVQSVKCRVLFDDADEAREWNSRAASSRVVQETIAMNMQMNSNAVQSNALSRVEEVDAITLKLDSDSSEILCGACLLYNTHGHCEKVVHYSDKFYANAVAHSGDSQVNGKSVHQISIVQSRIPSHISSLYFTLCSCGPDDLSGFPNPSIMLYDHSEPDANLLEYSIEKAGRSPSCVMAQLSRRPKWTSDDRVSISCALRRKRVPYLCIDLCLAMAAETSWEVKALGAEEWHLQQKICCSYESCKRLIEHHQQQENSRTRTI